MAFIFQTLRNQIGGTLSLIAIISLPILSSLGGKGDVFTESILAAIAASSTFALMTQKELDSMFTKILGKTSNEFVLETLQEIQLKGAANEKQTND